VAWREFCSVIELISELPVTPLDPAELFGREAPLHVDLGCGDGSFLCELALQLPEKNFLGIERLRRRVEKARRKSETIDNVRVLRAEISHAVRYLLPENSVATFYLLFPDPWPKRRHQRRRIFTCDFLDCIAAALQKGGLSRVTTDQLDYFQQIEGLGRVHPQFEIVDVDDVSLPSTKFERRFCEKGAPIYRLTFRKVSPVK
jgi:tRNA (guanine-N7-)-methyltransferase